MPAPKLARAGPAEAEDDTAVLDQPVHLVQQCGNLLDLVDDHEGLRIGQELFAEAVRLRRVASEQVGLEEHQVQEIMLKLINAGFIKAEDDTWVISKVDDIDDFLNFLKLKSQYR